MEPPSSLLRASALGTLALLAPSLASAQAFTPPEGLGSVTFSWQLVDNTGHRFSDGLLLARGQSRTTSVLFEVDYGITDRLAATIGIPYVFAKYTGALPPASGLPVDSCQCWHSSFQDFGASIRYRFGDRSWAVTPVVRYGHPSHPYDYLGEAVVGKNLREVQAGISTAVRLRGALRKASVQGSYLYSFVEKPIESVSVNRTNGAIGAGYALTSRLYLTGNGSWQQTHGGLRIGSPSGNPFPPPGELGPVGSERFQQRDRLLRVDYWQVGGGASYSLGPVDVFGSVVKYVWGRNAHDGQLFTLGVSWYFDLN